MSHKVYNWQLNRKMSYKYQEKRPEKQVAWVFDTNKCIACQTCTIACKNAWTSGKGQEFMFWNNVETKPWGFYPLGWDIRLLEKLKKQGWDGDTYEGKTIFESLPYGEEVLGFVPSEDDYQYPNIGEDEVSAPVNKGEFLKIPHQPWMFYLQRICNHCTYPACLHACTRKSIYKRKEDGIVLIDQKRCRGYQECVGACPYKKPMYRSYTDKSEKCISCYPAVEQGKQTQCVVNCIGKIRMMGYMNRYDEPQSDNPIDYLVHKLKIALPLYPQFGTEPNVYYIPPVNVPDEFNKQLFGPGAKKAVELYKNAVQDLDLIGLLMLFGCTDKIVNSFKVEGDLNSGSVSGFDDKKKPIVKVPLKEPIVIRKEHDEKRNVHRISIS
jgi:nitrate reductase / nitrite oxidoreductase, beta subunit